MVFAGPKALHVIPRLNSPSNEALPGPATSSQTRSAIVGSLNHHAGPARRTATATVRRKRQRDRACQQAGHEKQGDTDGDRTSRSRTSVLTSGPSARVRQAIGPPDHHRPHLSDQSDLSQPKPAPKQHQDIDRSSTACPRPAAKRIARRNLSSCLAHRRLSVLIVGSVRAALERPSALRFNFKRCGRCRGRPDPTARMRVPAIAAGPRRAELRSSGVDGRYGVAVEARGASGKPARKRSTACQI